MATLTADPREEERAARERQRQLDKLQRAAAAKRERESKSKLSGIIRDELARPRGKRCQCGITPRMSLGELLALGAGCTAGRNGRGGFICPTLDAIRRRMGR